MSTEWQELLSKSVDDALKDPLFVSLGGKPKKKRSGGTYSVVIKEKGFEFAGDLEDMVRGMFFHGENHDGFHAFRPPLPNGLKFNNSRSLVRNMLGKPNSSAGGKVDPVFGKIPTSDRYELGPYRLTVSFSDDEESIVQICLERAIGIQK
jgi:hypothetical protein